MGCLDYGRSFICNPSSANAVRFWVESRTILIGRSDENDLTIDDPSVASHHVRIERRGDGRCIGGFLSLRTWALVALMMVAGRTLRHSFVPAVIIGLAYAAVGTALLVAAAVAEGALEDLQDLGLALDQL